jgi:hypothetical protein
MRPIFSWERRVARSIAPMKEALSAKQNDPQGLELQIEGESL